MVERFNHFIGASMKFQIYKDSRGEWRWRIRAANGKIVADSGEGYKNQQDCIDMIRKIVKIEDVEFL